MEAQKNETANISSADGTIPKVTGVGGIFFFSDNPKETSAWYSQHLGFETSDYGSSFESRNIDRPEEINTLQWCPFKKGSDYFAPSKKDFMINYRVQNIEGLVKQLKDKGQLYLTALSIPSTENLCTYLTRRGTK